MPVLRPSRRAAVGAAVLALALVPISPALADHTNPGSQLAGPPASPGGQAGRTSGPGTWTHLAEFSGVTGTDLEFFRDAAGRQYVSAGSLGQAPQGIVGQRVIRLTNDSGAVAPALVADHGSAQCADVTNAGSTTGLQHDAQVTPSSRPLTGPQPAGRLLIDTTDATSRCHDSLGGGLEIIDISGLGTPGFAPREIGLTRHNGYSHTVTVDATRPWIVYNNSSDSSGNTFIDVLDIRTCLNATGSLADKRAACRPAVKRMDLPADKLTPRNSDGTLPTSTTAAGPCHDNTARPGKLYCAALDASVIIDVAGLTDAQGPAVPANDDPAGDVKGAALPCTLIENSTRTGSGDTAAMVTDCSLGGPTATSGGGQAAYTAAGRPQATGWSLAGGVQHQTGRLPAESVAVSHEFDPSPDGTIGFITDERGGGVSSPGAACFAAGLENTEGNGGIHAFDLTKRGPDGDFPYLLAPGSGSPKAIFRSSNTTPSPTFCDVHVIEQVPDEQRLVAAYYTQGVKLVDYAKTAEGRLQMTETASMQLPGANTWAVETFKTVDNPDGTRTYFMVASDIERGVDVYSYRGPKATAVAVAPDAVIPEVPLALVLPALAGLVLGGSVLARRRRALGGTAGS